MAIKHLVTRGFTFSDGLRATRGYIPGAAAAVLGAAIKLTLYARSLALTLHARSLALTLRKRP